MRRITASAPIAVSLVIASLLTMFAVSGVSVAAERERHPHSSTASLDQLDHLVVIYLENHSFDNLYGFFDGAEGIREADDEHKTQVSMEGKPYETLPQTDPQIPQDLPNEPFDIGRYVPPDKKTRDLVHRFYQQQVQINDGAMNKFTAVSDAKGLTQGYYDTANLPLAKLAKEYTLADNFFQGAFGGSFLNHFWLVCACTPTFPGAPPDMHTKLDVTGLPLPDKDKEMTQDDDYVVNTAYSVFAPHPATTKADHLVPPQTEPTIGDRLSQAGVDWAWYSGGWNDAVAGRPDPLFQFHHQPFAYFAAFGDGSPERAAHLKDETDFFAAAHDGTLPAVSFVKPIGTDNEHPGYADLVTGENHAIELVDAIRSGPEWEHTAIVITYDENGGFWDHVPPPVVDRWGPGTRVPTIVISPFAKRGFVDHTYYDTTSILALIERRWDLEPLADRDADANDLTNAFEFCDG